MQARETGPFPASRQVGVSRDRDEAIVSDLEVGLSTGNSHSVRLLANLMTSK
jgi:hypothetical protein